MVNGAIKERMLLLAVKRLRNHATDLAALRHELHYPAAGSPVYLWNRLHWISDWWNGEHSTSIDAELLELIDWWVSRPPAEPAPVPDVAPLPVGGRRLVGTTRQRSRTEDKRERQARRLSLLRAKGGDMRQAGTGWQCYGRRGALAELIREEAASGAPRSKKADVRRDLIEAMEREKPNT